MVVGGLVGFALVAATHVHLAVEDLVDLSPVPAILLGLADLEDPSSTLVARMVQRNHALVLEVHEIHVDSPSDTVGEAQERLLSIHGVQFAPLWGLADLERVSDDQRILFRVLEAHLGHGAAEGHRGCRRCRMWAGHA